MSLSKPPVETPCRNLCHRRCRSRRCFAGAEPRTECISDRASDELSGPAISDQGRGVHTVRWSSYRHLACSPLRIWRMKRGMEWYRQSGSPFCFLFSVLGAGWRWALTWGDLQGRAVDCETPTMSLLACLFTPVRPPRCWQRLVVPTGVRKRRRGPEASSGYKLCPSFEGCCRHQNLNPISKKKLDLSFYLLLPLPPPSRPGPMMGKD